MVLNLPLVWMLLQYTVDDLDILGPVEYDQGDGMVLEEIEDEEQDSEEWKQVPFEKQRISDNDDSVKVRACRFSHCNKSAWVIY